MSPFWTDGQKIDITVAEEQPRAFLWRGREHRILEPAAHWRIHTAWWRETEIWRDYWEAPTDTGLLCVLYQDLGTGEWFLERVRE